MDRNGILELMRFRRLSFSFGWGRSYRRGRRFCNATFIAWISYNQATIIQGPPPTVPLCKSPRPPSESAQPERRSQLRRYSQMYVYLRQSRRRSSNIRQVAEMQIYVSPNARQPNRLQEVFTSRTATRGHSSPVVGYGAEYCELGVEVFL
jgi:hypothetical protein